MIGNAEAQVIRFRETPVLSGQLAPAIVAGAGTGAYLSCLQEADMSVGHFLQSFLTIAVIMLVLLTARNLYLKHKYGQRRISFFDDHIMMPAHFPFGEDIRINYDEIRALKHKTWLSSKSLVFELDHQRVGIPLSAFADHEAAERFQDMIAKRIGIGAR